MENSFLSGPNQTNLRSFFSKLLQEYFHPYLYFNKFVIEKMQPHEHVEFKCFKDHLKSK